ncbi:MFS transporter [Arthrobacter sp. CAN_C5]|uniref:MFS transporter n=1 Tax=Arthrobacter sp. CAN_C5 TaxID=2760706 RepID=UPI001AE9485C|nr:MFS transporter [Arthrobacter sp. CAN_C5]MBP2216950.1 MFS family permease [Arthrobacter sp. CAN_C5]
MPAPSNISTDTGKTPPPLSPAPRHWLAAVFADRVLRLLAAGTLVSSIGRGVFMTVTVLYLTFIVGLSVAEVAVVLTAASAVGVATSMLGGILADRVSARRLLVSFVAIEGLALACFPFAGSFWPAVVIACLVVGGNRGANTARSAIIGRAFTGSERVGARAVLRTVQNIGVAVGGAIAAVPLLINTPQAYYATTGVAAAATLASMFITVRLPGRVDAARHADSTRAPRGGRSVWKSPRYLALAVLSALFGLQFGLAEVGLPLWIAHRTDAPIVMVSILLVINTVLVIALQMPLSRGTHDLRRAGNVVAIAGITMALTCGIYSATAGVGPGLAVALLAIGMTAHTFAEILSSAGTWGLSYELAEPERVGEYQGMFAMAFSIGMMFTPGIMALTVIQNGMAGWVVLATIFLGSALGMTAIARRAAVNAGQPKT